MPINNESFDLIHAKRELDTMLSAVTGIVLSGDTERAKPAPVGKTRKRLPAGEGDGSFDLIREKEAVDAFLSGITMPRMADGVTGENKDEPSDEALKERRQAAVQKVLVSPVSGDGGSPQREPEIKESVGEEIDVPDRVQEERRTEVGEAKDKQTVLTDEKPAEKEQDISRMTVEGPPQEAQRVKEKTAGVKTDKKSSWSAQIRIIGLFAVFIVITQAYLWLHPNATHQTIEWMRTHIPVVDRLLNEGTSDENSIINKIELVNVRQRFVQNESSGTLLILEGTAVNHADFAVAKVKIMGEIADSQGKLLAARTSYCGNVLSDEALGRVKEEDIRARSSISKENAIMPKERMPFMIIFERKGEGGAKATAMAVSAEKVSP